MDVPVEHRLAGIRPAERVVADTGGPEAAHHAPSEVTSQRHHRDQLLGLRGQKIVRVPPGDDQQMAPRGGVDVQEGDRVRGFRHDRSGDPSGGDRAKRTVGVVHAGIVPVDVRPA